MLSLLFLVKALFLAFWVTPLWDVPDEIGHFSYVRDLAEGKGIPLLGEAKIGADVMGHLYGVSDAAPASNWIAQHPPLYYVLAALPLKIGSWLTHDVEILYRLPRMVSALSGALLLLVLFRTFRLVGLDSVRATAIAASVGFIPMFSHLASGTNHDVSLFLFSALATHFFARYVVHRELGDAYRCAAWLAVAAGTKMTAWVLLAPMLAILLLELAGPLKCWMKHAAGISLLALSVPLAWMARNMVYFGNPFYTSATDAKPRLDVPLDHGLVDYLHLQPVFEHFMLNFYGLLGWIGTGMGELRWFQVDGLPRTVYSIVMFVLACMCAAYVLVLVRRALKDRFEGVPAGFLISWLRARVAGKHFERIVILLGLLTALLLAVYIGTQSYVAPVPFGLLRLASVALSIFVPVAALGLFLYPFEPVDRLFVCGQIILIFFGFIVLYEVYGVYLWDGRLRATHGRYFYPIIPLVLLSAAIVLMRMRIPAIIVAVVAAVLAYMELETFLFQALPLYLGGQA